jgi:hypothetical protein
MITAEPPFGLTVTAIGDMFQSFLIEEGEE